MCMGSPDAPRPQPRLPEAPTPPSTSAEGSTEEQARRRRRAAAGNTILTGPQGETGAANVERKTLLGA